MEKMESQLVGSVGQEEKKKADEMSKVKTFPIVRGDGSRVYTRVNISRRQRERVV